MKLGIVSDALHYRDNSGGLYVLEILSKQLSKFGDLFDEVYICAPFSEGSPPATHAKYSIPPEPLHFEFILSPVNAGDSYWEIYK